MAKVQVVEDADFGQEVESANQPVVVDFTAEWCPPCKMLAPVLERVAGQFEGKVKVVKCDIDRNTQAPARYGVMKIPNLVFFKDGQVVDQTVGYLNETQLAEKFKTLSGS